MSNHITLHNAYLLARYGICFQPNHRTWKCRELLARVREAAFYVELTGHAHPFYGDGSIASLALRTHLPEMSMHLTHETLAVYGVAFREITEVLCHTNDT